jgi:hypothetical protein
MNYNSTCQRKKNLKYHFGGPSDESQQEVPDAKELTFFYQICAFADPKTDRYHLRKYVVNGKNEFLAVQEYFLNKQQCRKFFDTRKDHEYRSYPVYSLNDVQRPAMTDILLSKSQFLNHDYSYSGFAPF